MIVSGLLVLNKLIMDSILDKYSSEVLGSPDIPPSRLSRKSNPSAECDVDGLCSESGVGEGFDSETVTDTTSGIYTGVGSGSGSGSGRVDHSPTVSARYKID